MTVDLFVKNYNPGAKFPDYDRIRVFGLKIESWVQDKCTALSGMTGRNRKLAIWLKYSPL